MDAEKKALKIKCDVCTRLLKDIEGYKAEEVEQRERVDALLAADADASDVRAARELLAETNAMLPDCAVRLSNARDDLRTAVATSRLPEDDPLVARASKLLEE
eukprot:TRINITY_DN511_c0_g1_i1.p3 TRINITY_DN511_c0_g1~~TRINITY_DN511_c0_g1_i1.p3  ORF type:complete len:103 (-),score=28.10 TRINITY_DN511_c0_g1_i1:127-435(-)